MMKSVYTVFVGGLIKKVIYHLYEINIRHKRNVEEDVLAFIIVYRNKLPKLEDVKQVMKNK